MNLSKDGFSPFDASEAEAKVLGTLLAFPQDVLSQNEKIDLKSKHFGAELHAKAWGFLYGRASRGETINPRELKTLCKKELREMDDIIRAWEQFDLWKSVVPTWRHFVDHAGIIIEAANRRVVFEQISKAAEALNTGDELQEISKILTNAITVADSPLVTSQWSLTDELDSMIASTPEHLEEMKRLSRESVFVLPEIAISGEMTIINASPNAGKTLLTCWLLSQRGKQARESIKVYFINADDTFDGGRLKGDFMRRHEVETLIPGQRGFSTDVFKVMLERSIATKSAGGVVFVLDTLKKFVDMMDKTAARAMNDLLRRFVQAGGTIIALAHVNKNKGGDGSSVAEGVGDFQNDFDAAYTIEMVGESESSTRTIVFNQTKSRGPNSKKATFSYSSAEKATWEQRFQSVVSLDGEEGVRRIAMIEAEARHAQDKPVIDYICQRLESRELSRREISQEDLTNGFSRSTREQVLDRYSDAIQDDHPIYWQVIRGETGGSKYRLATIPSVSLSHSSHLSHSI